MNTEAKDSPPRNIHEANQRIRAAMPYLQKQPAPNLNYKIVNVETILAEVRKLMGEVGVDVYPSDSQLAHVDRYETSRGGSMNRVLLKNSYTFAYTNPAGEVSTITAVATGEAADSGDKSSPKAMTAALKSCLRQVYLLETGELDPDTKASVEVSAERERAKTILRAIKGAPNVREVDRLEAVVKKANYSTDAEAYLIGACRERADELFKETQPTNGKAPKRATPAAT